MVWRVMSIQIMNSSTICKAKISNPIPILQALQILFQPDHLKFSQVWPFEHPKIKSIEKEGNQLKSNCELGLNDMARQSHLESTTWDVEHETLTSSSTCLIAWEIKWRPFCGTSRVIQTTKGTLCVISGTWLPSRMPSEAKPSPLWT